MAGSDKMQKSIKYYNKFYTNYLRDSETIV